MPAVTKTLASNRPARRARAAALVKISNMVAEHKLWTCTANPRRRRKHVAKKPAKRPANAAPSPSSPQSPPDSEAATPYASQFSTPDGWRHEDPMGMGYFNFSPMVTPPRSPTSPEAATPDDSLLDIPSPPANWRHDETIQSPEMGDLDFSPIASSLASSPNNSAIGSSPMEFDFDTPSVASSLASSPNNSAIGSSPMEFDFDTPSVASSPASPRPAPPPEPRTPSPRRFSHVDFQITWSPTHLLLPDESSDEDDLGWMPPSPSPMRRVMRG
ncbi:hypothetical protein FN846DRAFT_893044 [Sphaerosporella brunnea]|uniref:Uncharacterized protein n=1 Tax=Sphaerosporella brunnea TaxID=1250544 RepID=A0A5J5ELZ9_9PEZI|nr:hypothetical protein FN846DRAFT_893044 [Sphaerosporella brunnea]